MLNELKPVLVVGAGPTGMMAAVELSRFGIPVRLVEKNSAPETTSRAIGVQARTLELLEQRGLAQPLVELGNPAGAGSIYVAESGCFNLISGTLTASITIYSLSLKRRIGAF